MVDNRMVGTHAADAWTAGRAILHICTGSDAYRRSIPSVVTGQSHSIGAGAPMGLPAIWGVGSIRDRSDEHRFRPPTRLQTPSTTRTRPRYNHANAPRRKSEGYGRTG
jgi:hypothetical protein